MDRNSATQDSAVEAAEEGDTSKLRQLVQHHGFQVNRKLKFAMGPKTTVLHVSAQSGQTETLIALVREFGADVNARDNGGKTALHWASENGQRETVIALVREFGADVNARDKNDKTALHLASKEGKIDNVTALIREFGADVNARDDEGQTALHLASMRGWLKVVSILVSRPEIELIAKNKEQNTPLDVSSTVLLSCVIRTALLAAADEEDTEKLKQKLSQDLPKLTG